MTFRQAEHTYIPAGGMMPVVKSQPAPGDVFVSRPLTEASLAYWQDDDSFVADKMFPGLSSPLQAGSIWEWDRTYFLRNEMDVRGPNAESAGAGLKLNSVSYGLLVYALHHDIEEQRSANEIDPISSDDAAVLLLTQQAKQFREIQLKSVAFGTGKWTGMTDQAGVSGSPSTNEFKQWNDSAATPVKNITDFSTLLKKSTGVRPNTLAMGRQVWDALKTCPDILDRIKYSSGNSNPALVTRQAVAALFEVNEILISDVAKVTSLEGAATATFDFVIGKEFVLFHKPRVAARNMPSAGYTMNWTGYMGATSAGARMKRFYIPTLATWRLEIEQSFVQKITSSALGGYASSVVA